MLVEPGPQDGSGGRGQTIAAAERAMDVLLLFARSRQAQLGITEISRELGLPKAAIHRIPASLRSRGLIGFDQVTPLHEFIMSVPMGVPFPLRAGVFSKAFLAFLPAGQAGAYLSGELAALTPDTITDPGCSGQSSAGSAGAAGHSRRAGASPAPRRWPRRCSTIWASRLRSSACAGPRDGSPRWHRSAPGRCPR